MDIVPKKGIRRGDTGCLFELQLTGSYYAGQCTLAPSHSIVLNAADLVTYVKPNGSMVIVLNETDTDHKLYIMSSAGAWTPMAAF